MASAAPRTMLTPKGTLALSSMPALGSTPTTLPEAPTSAAASRAVRPVPVPMSNTRIPGTNPARDKAERRYQDPLPNAMARSMRS